MLKIIGIQNHVTDGIEEDSVLFGFKLARELAYGLKKYDGHFQGDDDADEAVRRSLISEKERGE